VIVTGSDGRILDAMRRLPRRGEVTGGSYAPEESLAARTGGKDYAVREIAGEGSFNEKIDRFYAEEGGALSLETLREQARRHVEGSMGRVKGALEKLRAKEAEFADAERLREYGDIILANTGKIRTGDEWLSAENFYAPAPGGEFPLVEIALDPRKSPGGNAEAWYGQYRKAKQGLLEVQAEIRRGEEELAALEAGLARLLAETNPLNLHKLLRAGAFKAGNAAPAKTRREDEKRPGLSFRRGDWLIMVGRDAAENDALLRRHVRGNDLWLHARDFPGSYVFIRQRQGKSFPLEILLDAGNLALFYSKGRNNGEGDLFYTPVKYLRRAKDGPRGLVLPTQEKNLRIKLDEERLRELEHCRVETKNR
jgi:predicted ribosome quality control (RQC) complex YloA/Tae2 family protein